MAAISKSQLPNFDHASFKRVYGIDVNYKPEEMPYLLENLKTVDHILRDRRAQHNAAVSYQKLNLQDQTGLWGTKNK
jgi:hypothetical protein